LSNDYFAVVSNNAGANICNIYDPSANPSTHKVTDLQISTNFWGAESTNEIVALPGNNFFVWCDDEYSNVNVGYTMQYVSATSWISQGITNPFPTEIANVFSGSLSGCAAEGTLVVSYPMEVTDNSYDLQIALLEGQDAFELTANKKQSTFVPHGHYLANGGSCRAIMLSNKKILIMWADSSNANAGQFLVLQATHFKVVQSANTVTITNNTGSTQNVRVTAHYN